jgi:hypothetical protein
MKRNRKKFKSTEIEEEFKVNQNNFLQGPSYKKKNTEANLANQTFSFICCEKS